MEPKQTTTDFKTALHSVRLDSAVAVVLVVVKSEIREIIQLNTTTTTTTTRMS